MEQVSPLQRTFYAYLGRALAFTYRTKQRHLLRIPVSSWIMVVPLALAVSALVLGWGWGWVGFFILLWLGTRFSYWRAWKMGYNQFVPDQRPTVMQTNQALPPNQKIAAHASGTFAVSGRQETVLLRPCQFWYMPLGDYVIMVQRGPERFLYQFFRPDTLLAVQKGWILFGDRPLDTVAITFLETWGSEQKNNELQYIIGGGPVAQDRLPPRTIYLSFTAAADIGPVWAALQAAAGPRATADNE
jgi:hypothetical protein